MVSFSDLQTYRSRNQGRDLSPTSRERLARRYLPNNRQPSSSSSSSSPSPSPPSRTPKPFKEKRPHKRRIRPALLSLFHLLTYHLIHLCLSFYLKLRGLYSAVLNRALAVRYHHHRTPELIQRDVRGLGRVPGHLSVILTLGVEDGGGRIGEALERLCDEVAEVGCWCAGAGIGVVSFYERTGILKQHIPSLHTLISQKLALYYGTGPSSSPQKPHLRVLAPHHSAYTPAPSPNLAPQDPDPDLSDPAASTSNGSSNGDPRPQPTLNILLLSETDGRDTLVDLTRTLAEMAQSKKLSPTDISTELIDAEISEITAIPPSPPPAPPSSPPSTNPDGVNGTAANTSRPTASPADPYDFQTGEPDLLIVFGPYVRLDGYPPWQVRLTEIHATGGGGGASGGSGVGGSGIAGWSGSGGSGGGGVEYHQFLRSLWRYAGAEFRFGR
ncbi:MAG: hypothetical protein Q9160_004522 [Pyrenula sp. 1 TL-2023]